MYIYKYKYIYISQNAVLFKFYLQIFTQVFNVVSSCHAADVPSVSDFIPNPMNYLRIYGRNRFY